MSNTKRHKGMTFKKEFFKVLIYAVVVLILWVFALGAFLPAKCNGSEVTITERVPFVYPPQCSGMSGEDFFDWATKFNESQRIVRSSEPQWFQSPGVRTRYVRGPQGFTLVREAYPTRYLNPDYVPPSPLMVINPYCKPKR